MAHRNAERIRALIEHPKSPFAEDDTAYLEGLADERLTQHEATLTALAAPPPAAEMSEEVKAIVANYKAAQRARKAELIRALTNKVNGAYTEAELTAMAVVDLEKLSKAVLVEMPVDYSGMGAPRAAEQHTDLSVPPDPWAAALAARKGA